MKKMMIIVAVIVATTITATAAFATTNIWHDQHRPISLTELPATAKSFIDKHFGSIAGNKIIMPIEHTPNRDYLAYHRDNIFRGV